MRARANAIELDHDTFGDLSASPLILIMGFGAQMIHWEEGFCEQLAEQGYLVVRFDNRDVGRSTQVDHLGDVDLGAVMTAAASGQPVDVP